MHTDEKKLWSFYCSDPTDSLRLGRISEESRGVGDLSRLEDSREVFRAHCAACSPVGGFVRTMAASQLYRFAHELKSGDYVLLRSGHEQPVDLGRITGVCAYDAAREENYRTVRWLRRLSPAEISSGAMREISYASAAPLFEVRRYAGEFLDTLGLLREERESTAAEEPVPALREFVRGELERQPAYRGCKEFVAGLLQAMGYRVTMLAGDTVGADMVAHRDELLPRVLVKVKDEDVCASDAAALRREMKEGECGILFTLGDLSPEVKEALSAYRVRGVDGAELTELTLRYYPALQERYRRMIPLKTVFVPVA